MFNLSVCLFVCLLVGVCMFVNTDAYNMVRVWGSEDSLGFWSLLSTLLELQCLLRYMCITGYLAHEFLSVFLFLPPLLLKECWEYRCMLLYCYTCVLRNKTQGIMLAWQARYSLSHNFPAPNEFWTVYFISNYIFMCMCLGMCMCRYHHHLELVLMGFLSFLTWVLGNDLPIYSLSPSDLWYIVD